MNNQDIPLCSHPLGVDEAIQLESHLERLRGFLGAPGNWGYKTKLGILTQQLAVLSVDVVQAKAKARVEGWE